MKLVLKKELVLDRVLPRLIFCFSPIAKQKLANAVQSMEILKSKAPDLPGISQWARKFNKVQAKKLVKSISEFFLTKFHFLQFQNRTKINF